VNPVTLLRAVSPVVVFLTIENPYLEAVSYAIFGASVVKVAGDRFVIF
jgi:hypothetical protein